MPGTLPPADDPETLSLYSAQERPPAESPRSGTSMKGCIFEIRKYTLHDGPGVRTTVFLKGCPLSCLWCCNPESQPSLPELVWAHDRCLQCGLCIGLCEHRALAIEKGGAHVIDRSRCQRCGSCADRCPSEALRLIGKWATAEEVLAEVSRDALYFENSGGGLTLSGGEPLSQPEFTAELLRRYKHEEKGSNTVVETCGYSKWSSLERISPYVDLFLYDIKHMDPAEHLRLTGRDNLLILDNARRLAGAGRSLVIRLPLIPGLNDTDANLNATAAFALSLPGVSRIDLLPYHRLGEPKYHRLGRSYALEGRASLPAEELENARKTLERSRIQVTIGG